ncbi:hypothetical protein [Paenibacillus sp. HJGM_3]|uniref:hypothetical protein n=1 Tax=Paenibacillus sp. HJGM_3 TaxID=3379816 RepID=UPI00385E6645
MSSDLSNTGSGNLFIQLRQNEVVAFSIRTISSDERQEPFNSGSIGLSNKQQYSFRNLVIAVFKKHSNWTDGELLIPFNVQLGILNASVYFRG